MHKLIIGLGIGALLSGVVVTTHPVTLPPCNFEDGSGQTICRWDAQNSGNGVGFSLVNINLFNERVRVSLYEEAVK